MNTILRSSEFDTWLKKLKDLKAKARIFSRIDNAVLGNFGDCKPAGDGISEMRIDAGPGYRVYFTQTGNTVYLLLAGGDKSTQDKDIARAKIIAREFKEMKK
ncbi:MAG: type II toxin-antitoxin system RelE/ParE family toxin [Chlorobiaceae bacterium]|jgi:putative addiction module killer protein|nr:type II toxin-antitoxin system RelE/ParE family toxin [Chlorobiaceae bacterium]